MGSNKIDCVLGAPMSRLGIKLRQFIALGFVFTFFTAEKPGYVYFGASGSTEQTVSITAETQLISFEVVATTSGLDNEEDLSLPTQCGWEPSLNLDIQIPEATEMWLWEVSDWSPEAFQAELENAEGFNEAMQSFMVETAYRVVEDGSLADDINGNYLYLSPDDGGGLKVFDTDCEDRTRQFVVTIQGDPMEAILDLELTRYEGAEYLDTFGCGRPTPDYSGVDVTVGFNLEE